MSEKRVFVLVNDDVRQGVAKFALQMAPEGWRVKFEPPKRTLDQNSLIHPTVLTIARAIGRRTDVESLRQLRYLLLEQWRFETNRRPIYERSFDGARWVCVDSGTSDLDKADCSEFIEFLTAKEAEVTA